MKLKDIKIGNKLMIGFSTILLITVIIGYIGYKGMKVIEDQQNIVAENILPSIESLLIIDEAQAVIDGTENALLANNISPEEQKIAYARIDSAKSRVTAAWKMYESLPQSPEGVVAWREFVPAWNDWINHHETFMKLEHSFRVTKTEQSYNAMSHYDLVSISDPFYKAETLLARVIDVNKKIAANSDLLAEEEINSAQKELLIAILIGFIVSILLGVIISRSITVPLSKGVKLAEAVAAGDLTVTIDIDQKDEIGQLTSALKTMVDKLKGITTDIRNGINILGTSSAEILSTVTEISTGASETAAAVSETTTTVEEVRQTAMVSNQKANTLMLSSQKAADSVEKGRESVNEVIESMKKIDHQMDLISETVLKLSEQNRTIGEITSSVADIADQSNLLAVNAAIEAAKAGEHGRGFTIVAQEIRSLADQSKKATTQVKDILNEINKSVNQAVGVTEQGARTVEEGRKLVEMSSEVIEILAENVEEAAQSAIQISSSNQQQMAGMEQIVPAMENIKLASEQNVIGIKQAQSAAHDINSLGQNLKQIIEKFKL
ncbi:MAG: methyl-accepting chemotaxis protein [Bacteroidales bacterium]|nr:methyl-accepting chemotaxis protein [Bacteroidales bacterium]